MKRLVSAVLSIAGWFMTVLGVILSLVIFLAGVQQSDDLKVAFLISSFYFGIFLVPGVILIALGRLAKHIYELDYPRGQITGCVIAPMTHRSSVPSRVTPGFLSHRQNSQGATSLIGTIRKKGLLQLFAAKRALCGRYSSREIRRRCSTLSEADIMEGVSNDSLS